MLGTVCMRLFSPYSFVLIMLVHVHIGESLLLNSCPENMMWNLRAKSLCGDKNKYMCLYDTNERKFRELCKDKPDFHRSGNIFVISGNLQYFAGRSCYSNRYQPHKWWTNGSSDCQYLKSMCNGEGQVPFDNGTISRDRKCRCDYTNYYTFLNNSTINRCSCDPTEEDCSCYMKKCKIDEVLTPDYDCVNVHAWTGVFVCPEHKASIFTKEKILPRRTTVCPFIIRDLSGTMQQSSARIALSAMFGVILIFGLLNIIVFAIFRKTRKLSREIMEKELVEINEKLSYYDYFLETHGIRQHQKDSIIENSTRCSLDQENEMQDLIVKQEDFNKQACIGDLEQNSGFKDIDLAVKLNSASSISSLTANTVNSPEDNINRIIRENKHNKWETCALVLCILFCDGFNTDWLTLKVTPKTKTAKLQDIVNEFEIDFFSENSMFALKSAFASLNGTYLKRQRCSTEYKIINDMIYQQVSVTCGKSFAKCFIKYASCSLICDQFLFQSFKPAQLKDDLIVLSEDEEGMYFERLFRDLRELNFRSTFHNKQLQYQPFVDKLIRFYEKKEDAKQVLKQLDINGRTVEDDDRNSRCSSATTPLIESASGGYVDIVNFLIDAVKCEVNYRDGKGKTALYKASEEGNTTVVQLLLAKHADVNLCTMYNESPLYVACKGKHCVIVDSLLQNNANVLHCTISNKSPLYEACAEGGNDIVELLLKTNADVNQCDDTGKSPLYMACAHGYTYIVNVLLQKAAQVNQCDDNGESPLYVACKGIHMDTVDILLQNNASVSQCTISNKSPLYAACAEGGNDIVELLLKKDADVNQCDDTGKSPLYMACAHRYTYIVNVLLQKVVSQLNAAVDEGSHALEDPLLQNVVDVNLCDNDEESPLYVACARGYTDIVEILLKTEVDVNKCNIMDDSPLNVACMAGYIDIVERLLSKAADVNICDLEGESPLHMACTGGHKDIVEMLLKKNADVNQCDNDGKSPLHVACVGGYTDIVEMLLKAHANINECYGEKQEFPLYVACAGGYKDIVEMLLKNGADVCQCNIEEETPLFVACAMGYTDIVELLLHRNSKASQCNKAGSFPLYVACARGRTDIVKMLLQKDPDVLLCTKPENSPLHVVCDFDSFKHLQYSKHGKDVYEKKVKDHIAIVELLISCKVDASKMDSKQQTPLDIAKKSGCSELINILDNLS